MLLVPYDGLMKRPFFLAMALPLWLAAATLLEAPACRADDSAPQPTIHLHVDATDLPRNLLRSSMTIQARPGPVVLHFVTWTPGNHAPSGPIQNVVSIEVSDCNGNTLEWDRDASSPTRISATLPEGCDHLRLSMKYIASQPSVISRSTDTYGRATFGALNWNTALFYPDGQSLQEITVKASLGLPPQWKYATSLRAAESVAQSGRQNTLSELRPEQPVKWIDFHTVPLGKLIDAPVIMGQWMSVRRMETGDVPGIDREPPHHYCVVGPDESAVKVPAWLEESIDTMVREAIALFAPMGFPRERFLFLHIIGDGIDFGVEHAESTLIGDGPRIYRDARRDRDRAGGAAFGVVPHEYFHAWCGKLVAPEGLVRDDFHTPSETDMLWVYEGLTTYYTSILSVRGGMTTLAEYLEGWTQSAVLYERRAGRLWRSVEDTARAAGVLRDRGRFWYEIRQGQEYYGQGALFWLEADALIRRGTGGKKSLDDFCRALFTTAPINSVGSQATYTRADVVDTLSRVFADADWDALIRDRIERPQQTLDLSGLWKLAGYRLIYSDEPAPLQMRSAGDASNIDLRTSLGIRLDKSGEVTDIVPSSPADVSGLAYGMKVLAVNGWAFSADRVRDGVRESPRSGKVELTVVFGERVEVRTLEYAHGPRWPRLQRIEGEPDILAAIATPLLAPNPRETSTDSTGADESTD